MNELFEDIVAPYAPSNPYTGLPMTPVELKRFAAEKAMIQRDVDRKKNRKYRNNLIQQRVIV